MHVKKKLAIGAAALGSVVSALVINTFVGHTTRLVDLIGLFGASFGAGAALVLAVRGPN